jgi:hypothetical protein
MRKARANSARLNSPHNKEPRFAKARGARDWRLADGVITGLSICRQKKENYE